LLDSGSSLCGGEFKIGEFVESIAGLRFNALSISDFERGSAEGAVTGIEWLMGSIGLSEVPAADRWVNTFLKFGNDAVCEFLDRIADHDFAAAKFDREFLALDAFHLVREAVTTHTSLFASGGRI
jgi:hypothetical protein